MEHCNKIRKDGKLCEHTPMLNTFIFDVVKEQDDHVDNSEVLFGEDSIEEKQRFFNFCC